MVTTIQAVEKSTHLHRLGFMCRLKDHFCSFGHHFYWLTSENMRIKLTTTLFEMSKMLVIFQHCRKLVSNSLGHNFTVHLLYLFQIIRLFK